MKSNKSKRAKVEARFNLGTDGAAFYLSHQDDFIDDPERPWNCLLETDIWRKESKAGRVAAFTTGGDGGYAFRITDGPLTADESAHAVQNAQFYLKVNHNSLALRSDYAQEWFDIPNGEYIASISAIARPEKGKKDLPDFVIAFAPLDSGKKPKAHPEPPQLIGLPPELEEDATETAVAKVPEEDFDDDDDDEDDDDQPKELPLLVAPGITVFQECCATVPVTVELWDVSRDLPGDGEFIVVPAADSDHGYRCRHRGGSMQQGGKAEFTMEGSDLVKILSRRKAKLLPMAKFEVFSNSSKGFQQGEMDAMEKEFAVALKIHGRRLGIKSPAEIVKALARLEYAIDRISFIMGQLQIPFELAHGLAFGSLAKQIAGLRAWMASPDREAEKPQEYKPGKADAGYIARILESPRETAPRLAYAEFLADKDTNRAEFIRLQCKLAELEDGTPEYHAVKDAAWDLRNKYGDQWAGPIHRMVQEYGFRRGFVEVLYLTTGEFLKNTEKLFASAPIDELRLKQFGRDPVATLRDILARPELTRVGRLWFGEPPVGAAGAELIAACPHLSHLGSLHMPCQNIGPAGLKALAGSPYLSSISDLWLCAETLGVAGAKSLTSSKTFTRLENLWLSLCSLGDAGIEIMANWPGLASVTSLDIAENDITRAGAQALANSKYLFNLRSLKIGDNKIGDAGVLALATSKSLSNLVKLDIGGSRNTGGCGLTDAGVAKLVDSPLAERLESLNIDQNKIGTASVVTLSSASKRFPKLKSLGLFMTNVTKEEKNKLQNKLLGVNLG